MFTGSHLRAVTDAAADDDNAGRHSTTTRATYRQQETPLSPRAPRDAQHHGNRFVARCLDENPIPIGRCTILLRANAELMVCSYKIFIVDESGTHAEK